ncbi:MAG: prenyltransferase [Deltaproteobacteria bacterium]|nr:prenyltransferase [Deltaproteobacteria bacterium]
MEEQKFSLKIWLAELRVPFFTASFVPVILGAVLAWHETRFFDLFFFILTLIGVLSLHAATNTLNDYFDYRSGNDLLNQEANRPFDGGSPFLVDGRLKAESVYRFGVSALLLGIGIGLFLSVRKGWLILPLGVIGVGTAYFYVEPRVKLASRGLGELLTGLCFGPLVVIGTYFVQVQKVSVAALIAGIPIGFLITNVLFINQFPDRQADLAVGKNHWVVRLGKKKAAKVYVLLVSAVYISVVMGILSGVLPKISLITLLTIPLSLKGTLIALREYDRSPKLRPAQALTILSHLATGLLLSLSFYLSEL